LADFISVHVESPRAVVGRMLAFLASATWKHEPVVALRTHFFVNEARTAEVCINRNCRPELGQTDSWWRRLFIAHRETCESCGSLVYSIRLCRRCGYVYLEGWAWQARLWTDRDIAVRRDSYERWLFRPVESGLPGVALESGVARTLCLACGRYFVGRDDPNFALTQSENHQCGEGRLLDIWVWRPADLDGGQLESCLFCEQHWFAGEEVATLPAPSPYAVSTVLVEELKRQSTKRRLPGKIISFSDTRQQAAQLALRLQRTNREFSFRQMVYQSLSGRNLTTEDLLDELYDLTKADQKLRLVIVEDSLRVRDNT